MEASYEKLLNLAHCDQCPLNGLHEPVWGIGPDKAKIVIVGEAPGRVEVALKTPFTGPSGDLLNQTLAACGSSRREVYTTNITGCRPRTETGQDAPPPPAAIQACRDRLLAEVSAREPVVTLALGGTAAQALLQTTENISQVRGVLDYREEIRSWVLPTYHPAAVLHGGLGFFDFIISAVQKAVRLSSGATPLPPRSRDITVQHVTTPDEAWRVLRHLSGRDTLSIDCETDDVRSREDDLLQIGLSDGEQSWVLEIDHGRAEPSAGLWERSTLTLPVLNEFRVMFRSDTRWILHNAKFDLQFFRRYIGETPRHIDDTMAMGLCLTEQGEQVGLEALSREWLNAPNYKSVLNPYLPNRNGAPGKRSPFSLIPRPVLAQYCGEDCWYTYHLRPVLWPLVVEEGSEELYHTLFLPAQRAFADVEYHGTMIDLDYVDELRRDWVPRMQAIKADIAQVAERDGFRRSMAVQSVAAWAKIQVEKLEAKSRERPLSAYESARLEKNRTLATTEEVLQASSPKQLQVYFFDVLKLPLPGGRRTTDQSFIDTYKGSHPTVAKLATLRGIEHNMQAYVEGIADDVWTDGRVHPDILLYGTVTGRLAIHNPPLQTIPRADTVEDKFASIKRLFVPPPGWVFVEADYKRLELFVMAHVSGDDAMYEVLVSTDFHKQVASDMFKVPYDDVTYLQREQAKLTIFGLTYGREAFSIAQEHGIEVDEAQEYIDSIFRRFPAYARWWHRVQAEAVQTGELTTQLGRKRRWSLIDESNPGLMKHIRNQAVNFPIQSLASDLTLHSLIRLNATLPPAKLGFPLFPVHDSVCLEVPRDRVEEAVPIIREIMEVAPFPARFRFPVDIAWSEDSWEGCHKS